MQGTRAWKRPSAAAAALALALLTAGCGGSWWQQHLAQQLGYLGHRNWICIVDSAYPAQSRAGIATIVTGGSQLAAVKAVLETVDGARHVRPVVYLDAELQHVPEADAPGIDAYRTGLRALLGTRPVKSLPHDEIIAKLDEAAKTFHVVILKTNLALPYTSVFLELDCGYWGPEAEKRLREAMGKPK